MALRQLVEINIFLYLLVVYLRRWRWPGTLWMTYHTWENLIGKFDWQIR